MAGPEPVYREDLVTAPQEPAVSLPAFSFAATAVDRRWSSPAAALAVAEQLRDEGWRIVPLQPGAPGAEVWPVADVLDPRTGQRLGTITAAPAP